MARIDEYTFLVTDLLTGDAVSPVILSSFYWDELYNAAGGGQATARIELPTTTKEIFRPWKHALWAVKDGEIEYGGIIGRVQPRGGAQVIQIPVHGFYTYFQSRLLRGTQGMSYATLQDDVDIVWDNVDIFHIFKDLIDHAQSFVDGNIGVGVTWDALSGRLLSSTRHTYNGKYIGAAIDELVARLNAFSFRQVYAFVDDKPTVSFKLEAPNHAGIIDAPLVLKTVTTAEQTVASRNALDLDGSSGAHAEAGDISGCTTSLEARISVELDDWTPVSDVTLMAKWEETGDQRSWRLLLLTSGKLRFEWSEDGTAATIISEDSSVAVPYSDGDLGTLCVRFNAFGSVGSRTFFYTSDDGGASWSAITEDPFESQFLNAF